MVKAAARPWPGKKVFGVGSCSDHVVTLWNNDLSTALLHAVKSPGGSDVYELEGGFAIPFTPAPTKRHMPVYTFAVVSLNSEPGDVQAGVVRCKRFKRWLAPEQWARLRARSG